TPLKIDHVFGVRWRSENCNALYVERPIENIMKFWPYQELIPPNAGTQAAGSPLGANMHPPTVGSRPTASDGAPPSAVRPESKPKSAKSLILAPPAIAQSMSAEVPVPAHPKADVVFLIAAVAAALF